METLVDQQRQQEGAQELSIRSPGAVAGVALFEGQDVDEHGLGAAEQDVIRRGVLQADMVWQEGAGEFERQASRGVQHLGRPFRRIAGERDPLVFQQQRRLGPVGQ